MHKLHIFTKLDSVVIVGEFCNWNPSDGIRVNRQSNCKFITINKLPRGEYRVLSCKSFLGGEINPDSKQQLHNRFFSDEVDETIACYF